MSVRIKLEGIGVATIEGGRWKPSNRIMKDLLIGIDNDRLSEDIGYHPFLDMGIAELAVDLIGAKIVEVINPPKFEPGVVY